MNVLYAGASTYPGVNEIVFTLPQNILTGCYVPLVAVTGNIISNVVNLPVHAGGGSCFEIVSGDTGDQILAMTQNITKGGELTISQTSNTSAKGRMRSMAARIVSRSTRTRVSSVTQAAQPEGSSKWQKMAENGRVLIFMR
jgi:hypothetical protein